MNFLDRMEKTLNEGLDGTYDLYLKARDKASEWGEKGMTKMEIRQLEGRAEKLMTKLGREVYEHLVAEDQKTVSKGTEGVRDILQELQRIQELVEARGESSRNGE